MKTNERLERNRNIVIFLTTAVLDGEGKPLLNSKGKRVYPTNRETGDKYGLDRYQISRIKNANIKFYKELMKKNKGAWFSK